MNSDGPWCGFAFLSSISFRLSATAKFEVSEGKRSKTVMRVTHPPFSIQQTLPPPPFFIEKTKPLSSRPCASPCAVCQNAHTATSHYTKTHTIKDTIISSPSSLCRNKTLLNCIHINEISLMAITRMSILYRFHLQCARNHAFMLQRPSSTTLLHPHQHLVVAGRPSGGMSKNDNEKNKDSLQQRRYHTTPKNEMFLYGTIILLSTLTYVGYKKYMGEPLKPKSASEAQAMYQKMEEERKIRNKSYEKSSKKKH